MSDEMMMTLSYKCENDEYLLGPDDLAGGPLTHRFREAGLLDIEIEASATNGDRYEYVYRWSGPMVTRLPLEKFREIAEASSMALEEAIDEVSDVRVGVSEA